MKTTVSNTLIPKGRILYFNEEEHKYTDDLNSVYTSCTTLIGKYHGKFDKDAVAEACAKIGKNPNHPKYARYAGKSKKQILWEWEQETIRACDKGTRKHNFLEDAIKSSNGYKRNANGFINDRIYTIDNIIQRHKYGILNLNNFKEKGVDKKYPKIYSLIEGFVNQGWKIYAEIGVYDSTALISGLIDILLVKGDEFIILDWKTNKAPIRFESGYYVKDILGKLTDEFVFKNEFFHSPISHLPDSVGNHYAMQLSIYTYLVESFGYKQKGRILCHIRTIEDAKDEEGNDVEVTEFYDIPYLKNEAESIINHYASQNINKSHVTLFN